MSRYPLRETSARTRHTTGTGSSCSFQSDGTFQRLARFRSLAASSEVTPTCFGTRN